MPKIVLITWCLAHLDTTREIVDLILQGV